MKEKECCENCDDNSNCDLRKWYNSFYKMKDGGWCFDYEHIDLEIIAEIHEFMD